MDRGMPEGAVVFTLKDAVRLGLDYVRRRFDRAAINIASTALAISFLSSLLLTDVFYQVYSQLEGATLSVETYQYWLVFVALAVSIVGITNAMLIAVYERYNEIGTMKCIGALDKHILLLFLVESLIQGFSGGVMGFFIGIIAALLSTGFTTGFNIIFKIPLTRMALLLTGVTALSLILSVVATLYPAWRASKLSPVEALSYEL
ncbi:MAG: ABC transporter permease [Candidatus Bathyarchaeia archaeon]